MIYLWTYFVCDFTPNKLFMFDLPCSFVLYPLYFLVKVNVIIKYKIKRKLFVFVYSKRYSDTRLIYLFIYYAFTIER